VATLTKSNLNADTYPLTAVYLGDAANLGSTSAVLNQMVLETTSAATLSSSPDPSTQGLQGGCRGDKIGPFCSLFPSEKPLKRPPRAASGPNPLMQGGCRGDKIGSDFYCEDFVADRDTDGTGYLHGGKDGARDRSTERRQGHIDDPGTARGLDQGHGDVLRRLKHSEKFSFGHADSAVKTRSRYCPDVPSTRHRSLRVKPRTEWCVTAVAMARKLAVHLYWMWRQGWDYGQMQKLGSHAGEPGNPYGVLTRNVRLLLK
jgi:hypothetical protein